ncbi:hypothetical protein EC957_009981 [Mortierella hygrophila]|uniref:F-box domain-containing protein n=1 Tax=Mortierella hygrophila TaxID=979708 RepID=A0A9P6FAH2_9FUNG|nr:hypothetical protein EC957_009981 [Mortierella hygrophila]
MSTSFSLPPEIFRLILNCLEHNQDTASLATLLRVSKSICRVTLPVLYADPYHLKNFKTSSYSSSADNDTKDLLALTRLLLRQSPYGQLTELLKAAFFPASTVEVSLPDPRVDHKVKDQLIDYRFHLRKLNLQPESNPFADIFMKDRINGNKSLMEFLEQPTYRDKPRDFLKNQIWKELTWALCVPDNLQELYLPLTELNRYQGLIDQLSRLSSVVFVNDLQLTRTSKNDAKRSRLFKGMVKFVERHATLFPNKLRQARCTHIPYDGNDCPRSIHLKLATILPLLSAPTFLDYTNWTQFVMRSKEVNLEYVKDIRGVGYPEYKDVYFSDRLFTNDGSFLQRCRSLETVDLDITDLEAQDMFRWAVKEKQESELDIANGRTPNPLPPLQEVSLRISSGTQSQILNDIAPVFGGTLSNLYISGGCSPSDYLGSHALAIDGLGWKWERLDYLALESVTGPLLLHPDLLLTCPSVKTLFLDDMGAEECLRGQPTFRYFKPAVLEHVKQIKLGGTPAAAFHPDTLHTTKNLEQLQLLPWDTGTVGLRGNFESDDDEEEEEIDNEQLEWVRHQAEDENRMALWPRIAEPVWTWDWDLPKLTRLSLSYQYAHMFQFKMFQGTPNLTHLRLTGASSLLGPLMQRQDYMSPSNFAFGPTRMIYDQFTFAKDDYNNNEHEDDHENDHKKDDEGGGLENAPATFPTQHIHLPKLVDLSISGNWEINTAMLHFMCSQLALNLESLALHGTRGLSAKELIEITSRNLWRLQQVNVGLTISSEDARAAGVIPCEDGTHHSRKFVLANPPQGYNPSFIFSTTY